MTRQTIDRSRHTDIHELDASELSAITGGNGNGLLIVLAAIGQAARDAMIYVDMAAAIYGAVVH